jgi:hypothetical protein
MSLDRSCKTRLTFAFVFAVRQGTQAPVPGRGPSGPWPRTVRASAEGTATGSRYNDWRPKRCQHTFGDSVGDSGV